MISSPSTYFVVSGIVAVALHLQQARAGSLYYGPYTVSGTGGEISDSAPFYGGELADENCAIEIEDDPTLPDVSKISRVPVQYHFLLANKSKAPAEPLYTKVGTSIIAEAVPKSGDNHDAYTTWDSSWQDKTALATSGQALQNVEQEDRRLEDNVNRNIAQLEEYFNVTLEVVLSKLPTIGIKREPPWTGPFWPAFEDGINLKWKKGHPSPAAKYALAFGLNVTEFMNNVSRRHGIDAQTKRPKCQHDKTCKALNNHSECGIRAGQHEGYCIPIWFGLCHAWAPASILEPEPRCPVTYNGVKFQPLDLKGLITTVYAGARVPTLFTGVRYKGLTNETDKFGRYTDAAQRDLNPGFFHIATANLLGRLDASFIVDVDSSAEVWNQPVRGFKVFEQTAMSLEKAAQTFYGLAAYPWNAAAKSIVYIKMRLSWIAETYVDGGLGASGLINNYTTGRYYHYILELDEAGVILGGEWVYNTTHFHVDFLWIPKARPNMSVVTDLGLSYANVSMLVNASAACIPYVPSGLNSSDSDDYNAQTTDAATVAPTKGFTGVPTDAPTVAPTKAPTEVPTNAPTVASTVAPTGVPVETPLATNSPVSISADPSLPG